MEQNLNNNQRHWNNKLFEAVNNNNLKSVKEALDKGADVNHQGPYNTKSAIDRAIFYNHIEIVKELLKVKGLNLQSVNSHGDSAIDRAIFYNYLEIVRELLKVKGLNLQSVNSHGNSAIDRAIFWDVTEIANYINNKLSNDKNHINEINKIIFTTQFSKIINVPVENIKEHFKLTPGNDNSEMIETLVALTLIGYREHNITSKEAFNEEINSSNFKALSNLKTLLTHCNKIADLDDLFYKEFSNSLKKRNYDFMNALLSVNPDGLSTKVLADNIARDPMRLIDFMNFIECNQKPSDTFEQYNPNLKSNEVGAA